MIIGCGHMTIRLPIVLYQQMVSLSVVDRCGCPLTFWARWPLRQWAVISVVLVVYHLIGVELGNVSMVDRVSPWCIMLACVGGMGLLM